MRSKVILSMSMTLLRTISNALLFNDMGGAQLITRWVT